jgi:imidazolonepropionase-like amidohydrolase
VEQGKLADLIVVEGNLADDIRKLETPGNMRKVMIAGRVVAAEGRQSPAQ